MNVGKSVILKIKNRVWEEVANQAVKQSYLLIRTNRFIKTDSHVTIHGHVWIEVERILRESR